MEEPKKTSTFSFLFSSHNPRKELSEFIKTYKLKLKSMLRLFVYNIYYKLKFGFDNEINSYLR
jgi:hypothetical protein